LRAGSYQTLFCDFQPATFLLAPSPAPPGALPAGKIWISAFLVSRPSQRLISEGDDYEYPARPGVAPNPQLRAFASIPHASIPATALGNDLPARETIIHAGFGS
jgi:hypothetical protein